MILNGENHSNSKFGLSGDASIGFSGFWSMTSVQLETSRNKSCNSPTPNKVELTKPRDAFPHAGILLNHCTKPLWHFSAV